MSTCSTTIDGSKVMQSNVKAYKLVVPIVGPGLIKAESPRFVAVFALLLGCDFIWKGRFGLKMVSHKGK